MLDAAEVRNLMRDEKFAPIFSGYLHLMFGIVNRARLDTKSRDPKLRVDALLYLLTNGLPVEVERPAKRSHKGWK